MATNVRYSLPPGGYNASNGGSPRRGASTLPHIEDLVAIPKDIDPNQSIRRLLEQAESSLRQSEMSRDFNRPAIALKDYIRASIIAVQIISKHQDYPTLKSKQGDATRIHNALLKKIHQQSDIYERIKQEIIADNQKTGVQPSTKTSAALSKPNRPVSTSSHPVNNAGSRPQPVSTNQSSQLPNGSPAKSKPAVHPKPAALHGNAISAGQARASSSSNVVDLAARFANLRGPQSSPGQDPRIKTYAIMPQKPAGPREMREPPPTTSLNTEQATALPKLPDAIYSPVRGNVSGEAARLPSSTTRGLFTRTASSTSVTGTSSLTQPRQSNEYFPTSPNAPAPPSFPPPNIPLPNVPPPSIPSPNIPRDPINIPDGDTITPEDLIAITKSKASTLIIDIRAREDFDDGHIMAHSIICIEPSILMRDNISSDEISESMILSPNQEQPLFEKRDSYDLVVFYDQDSEQLPRSPKDSDEQVIVSLHRALVHLNYGRDLRNPPKLLKGGLDAWVDLMGHRSLQSTPSTDAKTSRINKRHGMITRRGSRYTVTSLQPADVKAWQNTLANDGARPAFPRTGDEFLRFPQISTERQSMTTSSVSGGQRFQYDLTNKFNSPTQLPPPPARPRAAVQRPCHSGLTQADEHGGDDFTTQPKKVVEQVQPTPNKVYTGLHNPRNWCYANSTLQSLFASPGFGRELAESEWTEKYRNKVPRKAGEKMEQPQLMIQMISNMFYWMNSGKFQTMKASMLMDYSKHLCKTGDPQTQFGGPDQQDAQEFMSFVMDQLHDETNLNRDKSGSIAQPNTKMLPLLRAAEEYWLNYSELHDSIVDRYWRGLDLSTVRCLKCNTRTHTYSPFEWLSVKVDPSRDMTLAEALQRTTADNEVDDFHCNQCKGKTRAIQSQSLARMPSLLCVSFGRFQYDRRGLFKANTAITWDFNDVDFSPYFLNGPSDWEGVSVQDRAFSGPFKYECFAVIIHAGRSINTGHYIAYVRDQATHDPYAWYCCNDSNVHKVRIGSREKGDVQNDVFREGTDRVPYLVFFRRKSA